MNISILGTGSVGQALAKKLYSLGHTITIGTRDVQKTLERK
jgi:8-hydroxy-5-deazaflavin:NADPH oxidoreductase